MSEGQKVIKVIAIIFAIFLIVNIFGWLIFGISAFLGINIIGEQIEQTTGETIEFSEVYQDTIENIKIETAISKLTIRSGTELKVEGKDLPSKFSSKVTNNTLVVKEEGNKNIFQDNITSELIITIPQTKLLQKLEIESGIGNNHIENIETNILELDCGVGQMEINGITVYTKTEIDGGAGKTTIQNSKLHNLDLDTGVGEVIISADIVGNSRVDCGVGRTELNLEQSQDAYTITTKTGLGKMTINGEKCSDNYTYGTGGNYIRISGGVGSVEVTTFDYQFSNSLFSNILVGRKYKNTLLKRK